MKYYSFQAKLSGNKSIILLFYHNLHKASICFAFFNITFNKFLIAGCYVNFIKSLTNWLYPYIIKTFKRD